MKKHCLILILLVAGSLLSGCSKKTNSDPTPANQATIVFAGTIYSGQTTTATYNGGLEVNIAIPGGMNLVIYNMPTATGGSFNISNAFDTGVLQSNTDVYGTSSILINNLVQGSVSASGTLTKTGARSFDFSGVFQADLSSSTTVAVTGSGTY